MRAKRSNLVSPVGLSTGGQSESELVCLASRWSGIGGIMLLFCVIFILAVHRENLEAKLALNKKMDLLHCQYPVVIISGKRS